MASKPAKPVERRKVALIIANNRYARSQNALNPAVETGSLLAALLKTINFTVQLHEDLEKEMMKTIKGFTETVKDRDLILFYFSGHACSVNGRVYLLPISDRRIESDIDVEDMGTDAGHIIDRLLDNRPLCTAIIIFDCCRPYVLKNGSRSQGPLRTVITSFLFVSLLLFRSSSDDSTNRCFYPVFVWCE